MHSLAFPVVLPPGLATVSRLMNKAGKEILFYNFTTESILLLMIVLLTCTSLLFFFMTLFKKIKRLHELRKKQEYQAVIDDLLFNYLFNERNVEKIIESSEFKEHHNKRLFQQLMIKALIGLHHNYSGIYRQKLESFFAESGLAEYSLQKLNSNNWEYTVEGIRDLSSLSYMPAYPRIVSFKNHKNNFVKTEVLLGLIKLKGISELLKFKNSEVYFNDWVQSNILYIVKNHKIPAPHNLEELLESNNKSILLLAVRLINHYGMAEHYNSLSQFYTTTTDSELKKEIAQLLNRTEQLQ